MDDGARPERSASHEPHGGEPGGSRISRRAVVVGLGGAATVAAVAALVGSQLDDDERTPADRPTASGAGQPPDGEAIARVGEAYRAAYPDEDDVAVLLAALPQFEGLDAREVQQQLPTLRDQVRADFAGGDVVMVDGWLLAVTEARAAALVSLLR